MGHFKPQTDNQNPLTVAYENNDKRQDSVYSNRIKAGKRRTYFFDVRATRANDYFLTITESRKRFDSDGYERSKLFLYKEDFNKFIKGLIEAVDYVKTDLMPDFDFDAFNHENNDFDPEAPKAEPKAPLIIEEEIVEILPAAEVVIITEVEVPVSTNHITEEVDKW